MTIDSLIKTIIGKLKNNSEKFRMLLDGKIYKYFRNYKELNDFNLIPIPKKCKVLALISILSMDIPYYQAFRKKVEFYFFFFIF